MPVRLSKKQLVRAAIATMVAIQLCLSAAGEAYAWSQERKVFYQFDGQGNILPPRGIYPGTYITGDLKLSLAGRGDGSELAIDVELVQVTSRGQITPRQSAGLLTVRFYRGEMPYGKHKDPDKTLTVRHGKTVTLAVPNTISRLYLELKLKELPERALGFVEISR